MESVGGDGGDINITQRLRQDDPPWQKTLTVSAELEQLWRPVSQSAAPSSLSLTEPGRKQESRESCQKSAGLTGAV